MKNRLKDHKQSPSSPDLPDERLPDFISFETFVQGFEALNNSEEKLKISICYMRSCLEHKGGPYFRAFWDSRKLCLPLFKEAISRTVREPFWKEYIELTREGRRLKMLLDEETAFAVEQIDLAINALEKEVEKWESDPEECFEKSLEVVIPDVRMLDANRHFFCRTQKELNLLNTFAAKVHAMRKELVKQEMRIRQKNQFFNRLSTIGDRIFPPRRELIKQQSKEFLNDVALFVSEHFSPQAFSSEKARRGIFFFREEIKGVQAVAKLLTLNTHAFTRTREELSQCWDKLRGIEKELKKDISAFKVKSAENAQLVREKFAKFEDDRKAQPLEPHVALKHIEEIAHFIRDVELARDDVRQLKEELRLLKAPYLETQEKEDQARKKRQQLEEEKREQTISHFKQRLGEFKEEIDSRELSRLQKTWEEFRSELGTLKLTKLLRQALERELKELRDLIADKEKQAVLSLSGKDREALETLEALLDRRKTRRVEIKAQVEQLRKMVGSSGLDFEKAIDLSAQFSEEKQRLDKIDEAIAEIELKIHDLTHGTT